MSMDVAHELTGVKMLPIPTKARVRVFVPAGGGEMLELWKRWAGEAEFESDPDGCGAVIFSSPTAPWVPQVLAEKILPFFLVGGAESAVFEFQSVEKNFVRRDEAWFRVPGRIVQ